jgi:hypothetical protein
LALWDVPGVQPPTDDEVSAALATPVIPQKITLLQGRLALRQAGLIDQANTAVQASTPDVQDMWEYSATLDRQNPTLIKLAQQLNLSDPEIDQLFIAAASL